MAVPSPYHINLADFTSMHWAADILYIRELRRSVFLGAFRILRRSVFLRRARRAICEDDFKAKSCMLRFSML